MHAIPALVQRCTANTECDDCRRRRTGLQRLATSPAARDLAPPAVSHVLRQPGHTLEPAARVAMERRFGHDFSSVRVHSDHAAAASAESVGAAAYTVGSHIVFARDRYRPSTHQGRWLMAHELAHVVQQEGSAPPNLDRLTVGHEHDRLEEDAASIANQVLVGIGSVQTPVEDEAGLRRLTEVEFKTQLGATPQQRAAIDALFANAKFADLWSYLRACTASPHQDLGPLALKVHPGLTDHGVERFGGYSDHGTTPTLEINPTKSEHRQNPAELVDTVTHELIHAVDDLQAGCAAAGSGPSPLAGAATAGERFRSGHTPAEEAHLEEIQGPSASEPCGEFIDINDAAQRMITDIVAADVQVATVGRPTLMFVNMTIRSDPAAMTFYEACRHTACAITGTPARSGALGDCAADTIAKFIPPSLQGALLPARVHFDFDADTIRADDVQTADMVASFLVAHPTVAVELVGHADPVGPAAYNLDLGQRRANTVRKRLVDEGVSSAQITSTTSAGEGGPLSTGPATHWEDRRVEILRSP
ncbi:MAG TPA: DUF4157 domain-containing protein [Candidatus Dormibacteraeota bacterium]|nr:DUF4157 domain-containing protein [Candidatus Dormibacteraeota bacterium]